MVEMVNQAGQGAHGRPACSASCAGETVGTFVRLGGRVPWFSGFFGNTAAAAASAAASEGITALAPVVARGRSGRDPVQRAEVSNVRRPGPAGIRLRGDAAAAAPLRRGRRSRIHLLDRLNAVFKHRRLAGTAFVLVIAMMMLQTYSTIPTFQAQSRVQIQDERTMSVANITSNDPAFWQDAEQYYKTQYSILQSRALAQARGGAAESRRSIPISAATRRGPRDPISVDPAGPRRGGPLGAVAGLETARRAAGQTGA